MNMNHQDTSLNRFLTMPQLPSPPPSNNNNNHTNKMMKAQQWNTNNMNFPLPFGTSLLGMAAASMFSDKNMFPKQQQQQQQDRVDSQAITNQVLAELAEDSLFDTTAASDDIFDLEPVPLPENHHNSATRQQQQQEQQRAAPSRLALLEDTLNQVLNDEADFFAMEEVTPLSAVTTAPPVSVSMPVLSPSPSHNKRHHHQVMSISPLLEPSPKKQRTNTGASPCSSPITSTCSSSTTTNNMEDSNNMDDKGERFRDYQSKQWSEKFQELMDFKKERGHCCVPHTFKENPPLARWVKRQRYQYKLKNENKPSTMTDERILALEQMGFVWDSHGAAWEERLNELKDYRMTIGHCNVPSNFSSNPQLATWVKCQRRQYKLFWDGKPSNMTLDRISKLENLGFEWELRGPKKNGNNKLVAF